MNFVLAAILGINLYYVVVGPYPFAFINVAASALMLYEIFRSERA